MLLIKTKRRLRHNIPIAREYAPWNMPREYAPCRPLEVTILNVFMVITSTIYVHHRLHCVRINPLRAFGMHALNAFLSYNRVCEVRHLI